MDTRTRSTDQHHQHEQVRPSSGPVARIVAGSVAAGLVAAVFLVAVVFPGATEATITGSLLVAFGFGWAVMGWATTRFTTDPCTGPAFRPSRWPPPVSR